MSWFRRLVFLILFVLVLPILFLLITEGISDGSELGWFLLVIIPLAACIFAFWLLVELIVWMRAR